MSAQANRVADGADLSVMKRLSGHIPSWATAANDVGEASSDTPQRLTFVLNRSEEREAAFKKLLAEQQDPTSPSYHKWHTPEEIGTLYGPTKHDVDALTNWLTSQGLEVKEVAPSHVFVTVEGTRASVAKALATSFHTFKISDTENRMSATVEPSIPTAFVVLVSSVHGLVEHHLKSQSHSLSDFTSEQSSSNDTQFTVAGGNNKHYLAPGDVAKIYDITPVYNAGFDGTGQRVAVIGESEVDPKDISDFETKMGLNLNLPQTIIPPDGHKPGISDDEDEQDLDIQRVIGTAPGAHVDLVVSADKGNQNGVEVASQYEIQTLRDPTMSMSYGDCHASGGKEDSIYWDKLWSQAAGEGITVFISSGDHGASDCDTSALHINPVCASSFVTCAGGTEFNDKANPEPYWSENNSSSQVSALSYIPEGAWNDSTSTRTEGGGGGTSLYIPKPDWQTGIGDFDNKMRNLPDVSLSASARNGYYVCRADDKKGADCSKGQYKGVGGTSAVAPTLAGIMALLNQALDYVTINEDALEDGTTKGFGNLNPLLYKLAANDPQLKLEQKVFHDATPESSGAGTLGADGAYTCDKKSHSLCNNSTKSLAGYALTEGYDRATGLGSLDVSNFIDAAVAAQPAIAPKITGTILSLNTPLYFINLTQSVTFTATLNSNAISSGTVKFYSNGKVLCDAAPVDHSKATCDVTLPATGSYTISAIYSGFAGTAAVVGPPAVAAIPGYAASTATPLTVTVIGATDKVSLALKGGDKQSAATNHEFGKSLQVIVQDQNGRGVPNAPVFFSATASKDGASAIVPGTYAADTTGLVSLNVVANSIVGSYTITASLDEDPGTDPTRNVLFSLTNITPPTFWVNTTSDDGDTNKSKSQYGNAIGNADNCAANDADSIKTCTLRDALAATVAYGNATIRFSDKIFGTKSPKKATITLRSGLDLISPKSVLGSKAAFDLFPDTSIKANIIGPGADELTIDGNDSYTIFSNTGITTISGLTMTRGKGSVAAIDTNTDLAAAKTVPGYAGAIINCNAGTGGASLTLDGVNINGNNATNANVGGIYSTYPLTIRNSTISNNTGAVVGGVLSRAPATIVNSTLTGNTGQTGNTLGTGAGAIYNTASMKVINSTIVQNTAPLNQPGGILNQLAGTSTVSLLNSIIAANNYIFSNKIVILSTTIPAVLKSLDYSGFVPEVSNIWSESGLKLTDLGNYGGPVPTMIPLPGSSAICADVIAKATDGNGNSLATDQRGYPRTTNYPNTTTTPTSCVDAGAVQTNYSLAFTPQPPASVLVNAPLTPAPAVQLSESGVMFSTQNFSSIWSDRGVAITFKMTTNVGTNVLKGTPSQSMDYSKGTASFPNLSITTPETGETLTATLLLNASPNKTVLPSTLNIVAKSKAFDVLGNPTVTAIIPAVGSASGGTPVTITGTSFTGATSVSFGGTPATSFTVVNNTTITATSPAGTVGSVDITVTTAVGTSSVVAADKFTFTKDEATVELGHLNQIYTGSALPVSVTTNPAGLKVGITYNGSTTAPTAMGSYAVVATVDDAKYQGSASGTLVIAPAKPVLAFAAIPEHRYGDAPFAVSATSASSGEVTYAVLSGPATISGNTVTVTSAGAVTLSASQAATENYTAAATTVPARFTVNQAALAIVAKDASRIYGAANPVFTGTVTGQQNGDIVTESFATVATIGSSVGNYPITPVVGGANLASYTQAITNGTLTITQAPSTTALSVSNTSITPGASVRLTATVASTTSGTPTGKVQFLDGSNVLNTVDLNGGMASFATTLTPAATHEITAVYTGDTNFLGSNSSSSVAGRVAVAPLDFSVNIAAKETQSQTVAPGATASYSFQVTPLYGSYPATVAFTVTGLPVGASAVFSHDTIAADSGAQTVTMTVQTMQGLAANSMGQKLAPIAFGLLLLPLAGAGRMRKRSKGPLFTLLMLIGSVAVAAGLSGCGSGGTSEKVSGKDYNLTVTATGGNISHATTVTLRIK